MDRAPLESVTLPRGFRFHYQDGEPPRTPEPTFAGETAQPSPPRGPRLRIRRRNASHASGPTEQFLASVAAADIPFPTIETVEANGDEDMVDRANSPLPDPGFLSPRSPMNLSSPTYSSLPDPGFLSPRLPMSIASPPRTPLRHLHTAMNKSGSQRPDWSMDTYDPTRPSSSMSNPSDWSDDSDFAGSRISRVSEDENLTSPESDIAFDSFKSSKGKNVVQYDFDSKSPSASHKNVLNGGIRSKTKIDAPWSKEASKHLWQTYQIYLQDPTVTPFCMGASSVPPEGVIHRVARVARKSWRGPRPYASREVRKSPRHNVNTQSNMSTSGITESHDAAIDGKSGSTTPTAEKVTKVYIQWQHCGNATRNHLRDLCRRKNHSAIRKHRHFQSPSPTPFTSFANLPRGGDPYQEGYYSGSTGYPVRAYCGPCDPSPVYYTTDIALSLATSSSESMQPNGPLANLNKSFEPNMSYLDELAKNSCRSPEVVRSRRLGSPFVARTYGPSSSNPSYDPPPSFRQPETIPMARPQLRSPLMFRAPRSLNGTQKRRAQHALEDELSPNGAVVRPSILNDQLFGGSLESQPRRVRSRGFSLGDAALDHRIPGFVQAQTHGWASGNGPEEATKSSSATGSGAITPLLPPIELSSRFGSPLSDHGASNTFPRRLFQPLTGTSTIRERPFATVHHTRRSIESFDFGDGPSLQSRLTQLDSRLAEIRERGAAASAEKKSEA